jgi:hypothetical protein
VAPEAFGLQALLRLAAHRSSSQFPCRPPEGFPQGAKEGFAADHRLSVPLWTARGIFPQARRRGLLPSIAVQFPCGPPEGYFPQARRRGLLRAAFSGSARCGPVPCLNRPPSREPLCSLVGDTPRPRRLMAAANPWSGARYGVCA